MADDLIAERGKTHGEWEKTSQLAVNLMSPLMEAFNKRDPKDKLSASQFVAMQMITLKLARIVCGDPNHPDHWDDIAGYAKLGKGQG